MAIKQPRYQKYRDSRNLFNSFAINSPIATINSDGSYTIGPNHYYCDTGKNLKDLCPKMEAGKQYFINATVDNPTSAKYIYLRGSSSTWSFGTKRTITQDELDKGVAIYGDAENSPNYGLSHTVHLMINEGSTPLPYEPYGVKIPDGIGEDADIVPFHGDHRPVEVTVGRKSRNLLDETGRENTFTKNNIRYFYPKSASDMQKPGLQLKAGVTYTLQVDPGNYSNPSGIYFNRRADAYSTPNLALAYGIRKLTYTPDQDYDTSIDVYWADSVKPDDLTNVKVWVVEGSESLPYEPYGTLANTVYSPTDAEQTGEELIFENSYNSECEVSIAGKSEQRTLSGKNLIGNLWADNITTFGDESDYLGRFWGTTVIPNTRTLEIVKPNTKYTFSFDAEKIEGVDTSEFTYRHGTNVGFFFYSPSGKGNIVIYKNITDDPENGYKFSHQVTFTTPSDIPDDWRLLCYSRLFFKDQTTTNPQKAETWRFTNIQMENGSVATEFEPYCGGIPSPNPDYPQEIVSYPQELGYGIDFNQIYTSTGVSQQVVEGITYIRNGDGSFTVNGTATGSAFYTTSSNYQFMVGHTYLASIGNKSNQYIQLYDTKNSPRNFDAVIQDKIFIAKNSEISVAIKVYAPNSVSNMTVRPQFFDLTQMFGAGNEPSTVEEFREMFPDAYYPYTESEMRYIGKDRVTAYPMNKPYENPVVMSRGRNLCTQDPTKEPYKYSVKLSEIIKNGEYFTVTFEQDKTDINASSMYFHAPDGSYAGGNNHATLNKVGKVIKTIKATGDIGSLRVYNNSGLGFVKNVMVERGSVVHPYEPYHNETRIIDLQGHDVRSLPDGTEDKVIVYRDGRVELLQRVEETTLGSAAGGGARSYAGKGAFYFRFSKACDRGSASRLCCISDHLLGINTVAAANQPDMTICVENGYPSVMVRNDKCVGMTFAEAKEFMSDYTIVYPLATSLTIPLGTIDPIPSYYPTTILSADGTDITAHVLVVDDE